MSYYMQTIHEASAIRYIENAKRCSEGQLDIMWAALSTEAKLIVVARLSPAEARGK